MNYQPLPHGYGEISFDAPLLPRASTLLQVLRKTASPIPQISACFFAVNRLQDQLRPALKLVFSGYSLARTEFILPLDGEEMFAEVEKEILSYAASVVREQAARVRVGS